MNRQQTVLITGASSGIGRDLARLFAGEHYSLILVARDRAALEAVADELHRQFLVKAVVIACDLADRNALEAMITGLVRENTVVDVLVNNAGFGMEGPFSETDWASEQLMIDLNIHAVVRLTKAFLPQMISRNSGKILQLGSTAAFQPGPFYSIYFASKAFILSFSDALSAELRGTGVTITTVCPGPTHTGFERRLGPHSALFSNGIPISNSTVVASAAFNALMQGRRSIIPGIANRVLRFISTHAPRSFVLWVMAQILKKKARLGAIQTKNFSTP